MLRPDRSSKLMKKIIGLSLIGITVLCLAADFSAASFTDSEAAAQNFLSAGTLKLDIGESGGSEIFFELADIKPGSICDIADWEIYNEGSLDGDLSVSVSKIINRENGRTELETVSGDTTGGSDSNGELGSLAFIAVWIDIQNNNWDSGDYYFYPSSSKLGIIDWSDTEDIGYYAIDSFSNKSSDVLHKIYGESSGGHLKFLLDFPSNGTADNTVQGDSCNLFIEFVLTQ